MSSTETEWDDIKREEQQHERDSWDDDEHESDDYQVGDWAEAYEKWRIR